MPTSCELGLGGCLYGDEAARVLGLARFAEIILSHVYMRLWKRAGSPNETTGVTAINSSIFHKPEIRTFVSNFHDYNPQNRSLTPLKVEIYIEKIVFRRYIFAWIEQWHSARLGEPARVVRLYEKFPVSQSEMLPKLAGRFRYKRKMNIIINGPFPY